MKNYQLTILISNRNNTVTQELYSNTYLFKWVAKLSCWWHCLQLNELTDEGTINVSKQIDTIEKTLIKKKIITRHDNEVYLIRYSIFSCKLFSIKVHHILLSDPACLHDHPWTFISLLLKGSYIEHTANDSKRFGPLSLLYRPAQYAHRLEIAKPVWSLVITFKKVRQWGFITPAGWVEWFKYQRAESCD